MGAYLGQYAVWIITVSHGLNSDQHGMAWHGMALWPPEPLLVGHMATLPSLLQCACVLILLADSGQDVCNSGLSSTHLAYDCHCSVLWFEVTAPLQLNKTTIASCACVSYVKYVHVSHCCCLLASTLVLHVYLAVLRIDMYIMSDQTGIWSDICQIINKKL